jgi:hypothetical protein
MGFIFVPFLHFETHKFYKDIVSHWFYGNFVTLEVCDEWLTIQLQVQIPISYFILDFVPNAFVSIGYIVLSQKSCQWTKIEFFWHILHVSKIENQPIHIA